MKTSLIEQLPEGSKSTRCQCPFEAKSLLKKENSIIIEPCYIGENVELKNSIVGPHVSLGAGSKVENSVVSNSIIQTNAKIKNSVIENSMIGNAAEYSNAAEQLSLSDYSTHF